MGGPMPMVKQGDKARAKPRLRMRGLGGIAAGLIALAAFVLLASAHAAEGPDTTPPSGYVNGVYSPVSGTLQLRLYASDPGSGLANAEAQLDGIPPTFVRLGAGACPERPAPGTEPPPGACPASVSAVPLSLDTRSTSDGERPLRVKVTDGAGNTATFVDRTIVVRNAPPSGEGTVASTTVGVSGGGEESPPGKGKGCEKGKACERGKGGEKGKGLALKRKRCRAPHLAMRLARKPLWHTLPHHVPVLRYGRRYPYKGRLTCLGSHHRRVSAARGTPVDVYFRVWHLSFKRHHGPVKFVHVRKVKVGKKGRLKLWLGFRSGRTVLFRYYGPRRELAKSKLRLAVPPRTRKPPWGPR
jgi:hypothetical protein